DLDITSQPMEVAPTAHHFMGGIRMRVEDNRSTTVEGLYPVGEAQAGVHGGNRLGGNALAETQVFGARAGSSAAHWAKSKPSPKLDREQVERETVRLDSLFREGKKPQAMKEQIRGLMWQHVGIVRNREDLMFALSELERLGRDSHELGVSGGKKYNPEWCDAIVIPHMLLVCEAIVRSALAREESRGAHFRSDFPKRDDVNWFVNINLNKGISGKMEITTSPIFATRMKPSAIAGDVVV
ncbi:MAG: FAD-binding protein, partial [Methanomassiliicoccales archaeon]|nr:FAD-binding protein [Methanomassiliicoccales archaeon]